MTGALIRNEVVEFRSVPYAQAPVGKRRFSSPEIRFFKKEHIDATAYGPKGKVLKEIIFE